MKNFKQFIKDHKKDIVLLTGFVAIVALGVVIDYKHWNLMLSTL